MDDFPVSNHELHCKDAPLRSPDEKEKAHNRFGWDEQSITKKESPALTEEGEEGFLGYMRLEVFSQSKSFEYQVGGRQEKVQSNAGQGQQGG